MQTLFRRLGRGWRQSGFVICLLAVAGQATAQQAKPKDARLNKAFEAHLQAATFTDMLRLLVEKYHVSVVVDGYPTQPKGNLEVTGTIATGLDAIANAFDYDWALSRSGIVTMTKRFHNPDDYPQVNTLEMRRLARDITNTLQLVPFDPNPYNSTGMLIQLARMMTDTQWQTLRSGQGMRGSALTAEQTTLFQRAAYTSYFSPAFAAWTDLAYRLDDLPKSYVLVRKYSVNPTGAVKPEFEISWVYHNVDGQLTLMGLPPFVTSGPGFSSTREGVQP